MIPEKSKYVFTRTGSRPLNTYYPEITTSTDAEGIEDVLKAFRGFLLTADWQASVVDEAICDMADTIRDNG